MYKSGKIWYNGGVRWRCTNREKFLEHYHQRSNAETAFSQIKGEFGEPQHRVYERGRCGRDKLAAGDRVTIREAATLLGV